MINETHNSLKGDGYLTCIVGLKQDGVVYIGGDSLASNSYNKTIRKDKKVFKLQDTPNAVLGFTSSYRMGQLLMYAEGLIDNRDEPNIDHKYLVTKFIPNLIDLFEKGGYGRNNSGEKEGGVFLFGYKDKLYNIQSDYQVGEPMGNYDACGSGEDFALGSLHSTEGLGFSPEKRIHMALKAASEFNPYVAQPYYMLSTDDKDEIELIDLK